MIRAFLFCLATVGSSSSTLRIATQHWPDQLSLLWDGSASLAWWNPLEIGAGIGGTKICFPAVITTTVRNGLMVTTATVIISPIDLMHTHDRKNDGSRRQPKSNQSENPIKSAALSMTRRFRKSSSGRSRSSFRKTAFDPNRTCGALPKTGLLSSPRRLGQVRASPAS